MFPLIGYVTRFEQQGDRFSASVDVKVPEDVSHVQLDTEVFGSAAHAVPHVNSRNAELANISVHGPGRLKIQVGDEMRVMCFKTGELPECIASVHRRGASSRSFRSYQRP
jgi:hypothetical protein